MPKYDIEVQLTGQNGNAFNLLGIVDRALRTNGIKKAERDEFYKEATSGDYDDLLATCMKWVDVR